MIKVDTGRRISVGTLGRALGETLVLGPYPKIGEVLRGHEVRLRSGEVIEVDVVENPDRLKAGDGVVVSRRFIRE